MRILFFFISSLSILACSRMEESKRPFKLPVVISIQEPDSLRKFAVQSMVPNSAHLVGGVFAFTDTINLLTEKPESNTEEFYRPKRFAAYDSLSSDGLEIHPNYTSNIYQNAHRPFNPGTLYYPIYLVNQTPKTKLLYGTDGYVVSIQEAQDSAGRWYPIESRVHNTCSIWRIQLAPQHFVMLLLHKYKGNFKTKLRVRLQNGEQTYVSQPYEGWINPQQFRLDEWYYPFLKHIPLLELSQREFLGAMPKEAENEEAFLLKLKNSFSPITGE